MKSFIVMIMAALVVYAAAEAPVAPAQNATAVNVAAAPAAVVKPAAPAAVVKPAAPAAVVKPAAPAATVKPAAPVASAPAAPAHNATAVSAPTKAGVANGKNVTAAKIVSPYAHGRRVYGGYVAATADNLMLHTGAITGYIPRPYRRAIKNVEKTLQLLDRSHDAVTAHLRRLSILRAKVVAKYRALRGNFGVIARPPRHSHLVIPQQTRRILKRYIGTGLAETGAEVTESAEHDEEAEAEETEEAEEPMASLLEVEADAEVDAEADAEADAEVDAEDADEAEVDTEDSEEAEEPAFMEFDEEMFMDEPLN